jgi:hypothetical protein
MAPESRRLMSDAVHFERVEVNLLAHDIDPRAVKPQPIDSSNDSRVPTARMTARMTARQFMRWSGASL